ncbi:hypothetical protein WDZ17_10775 [Pseudokineococcus basanitobsidens]|uniref:Nucleotidyltransferase-like protein n=1 Tax=Pseudokineococcus basanitobsidens TaxID=1926649 RepID=A0ABU8RKZ9_9ACTN
MTDDEVFAELARRLRTFEDPDVVYVDGAFVLHRYRDEALDPPLHLHVRPAQLAAYVRVDEDTRDALWPDASLEDAGLNLFLVHVDETWDTNHDPARRHLVLEPRMAVVTDPAVPDEPPARAPVPDLDPDGEYVWVASTDRPWPADDGPAADGGPREGAGTRRQGWVLAAWLDAEAAYADGHLADATLQYLQDCASTELGVGVEGGLGPWLEAHGGADVDLRALVADDARAQALLRHLLAA